VHAAGLLGPAGVVLGRSRLSPVMMGPEHVLCFAPMAAAAWWS
jgi:hypothetical protein